MQFITMAVLVAIILTTREKKIFNPSFLFCIIWFMVICISTTGLYGLYVPSQYAYIIIFVGIVGFFLGTAIKLKSKKRNVLDKKLTWKMLPDIEKSYTINYPIVYLFLICSLLVILPDAIVSIKYILSGKSLGEIHHMFITSYDTYYASGTGTWMYYVFLYPTITSASILAAYDLWLGKRKITLQILTISLVLLRCIQFGGRFPVFFLIFFYVMGFILFLFKNKKDKKNSGKKKGLIISIVMVSVICLIAIIFTLSRLQQGFGELFNFFVGYFGSGITIMDQNLIANPGFELHFGGMTFAGLVQFCYNITYYVIYAISGIPTMGLVMSDIAPLLYEIEQPIFIGMGTSNAFVTAFYYFYKDGWFIGVFLFSFVWGFASQWFYNKSKKELNLKNVYFLLFFLMSITFSMARCWTAEVYGALVLVVYFLFVKKENIVERKKNRF